MITHEKPWRYEEDGLTVTRGSAWSGPGCHLGCGVLLYTDKEGKLVKVEGDKENPFNQGRLCVRCLALPEVVYSPERLQYPLKRAGERGENKWTRISWDEAFDTIEREFNKVKAEYGAESVIFTQGTGRDIAPYGTRLAWSFGSPNYFFTLSGSACYLPRVVSMGMTSGSLAVVDASQVHETRYEDPNYRVPETLIIWANNPIVSNSDGFYGHWVVDLMKRGTKLIVIDPRRTWLASKSELFLQIRPGTDAALALGMINIIIQEGLYDKEFVDRWTFGFDKFAARAAEYPVDKVSKITWVPEEKIIAAARMFAKSKPGAVQWGLGVDMTRESFPAAHAISALWAICGDIDVPGGMIPPPTMLLYVGGWGQNLLSKEQAAKKIGAGQYPLFNMFGLAQTDEMQKTLITGKPYPIKAAWIQTANVMACTGIDPKQWYEGFRKLDFVAVVDLFMTPTATAFADIVLPACTYAERNGLRFGDGAQRGETINKALSVGECKSDMEINLELGRRFNPEGWPWKDDVELFTGMLAENAPDLHMNFEQLREVAPTYPHFEYKRFEKGMLRADHEIGFNTPTGRVELYSNIFEAIGLDPLPYYEEPSESPLSTPELYKEYPLVLTTGARPWGMFHSEHRQIPHLRAIHPQPTLQIHPDTAAKYGVSHGEWVWVENTLGRIKRQIEITPIIDPRVVNSDHAWWFPEKEGAEPNLYGVWDVNINQLVPPVPGKSGMGSNVKSLLCKIYKVAEGEI